MSDPRTGEASPDGVAPHPKCTWCKGTGVAHNADMVPGETAICPCLPEARPRTSDVAAVAAIFSGENDHLTALQLREKLQRTSEAVIWHYMPAPGIAACGADYANMSKTASAENVTCAACIVELPRTNEARPYDGRPWNAMPKFDFWVVEREIVPPEPGRYRADVICEVHATEARYGEPARTAEENARRIADALNDAEGWYGPATEAAIAAEQRTEPARVSELDALWSCLFRGIAGDTAYVCRFCDAMFDTAAEGRDLTQHGDRCPLLGSAQRRESPAPSADDALAERWRGVVMDDQNVKQLASVFTAIRARQESADDEFWKNEVRVRQQEIAKLRKVAEAARKALFGLMLDESEDEHNAPLMQALDDALAALASQQTGALPKEQDTK